MERDKLKQMEKEKEKLARDEYTEKVKLEEKEAMEILKNTINEKNLLKKSRFVRTLWLGNRVLFIVFLRAGQ